MGCSSKTLLQESHTVEKQEDRNKQQKNTHYHNVRFEYVIAPHDRVQITIYNHPELSTNSETGINSAEGILVDSSGNVHLSLIGAVRIGGLTQPQASRKIQSLYGKYLKRPSAHLEVLNKKAYVIGEVKTPGVVKLPNEQTTLLEAIASVRGFSNYANKEKIVIMRKSGRGTKVEVVDLTDVHSLSYATMMIRPNDIVYVTSTKMKDVVITAMPLFRLASDALLPFIRYQDLTN
jgi:polysaccharide export outer membrane protein